MEKTEEMNCEPAASNEPSKADLRRERARIQAEQRAAKESRKQAEQRAKSGGAASSGPGAVSKPAKPAKEKAPSPAKGKQQPQQQAPSSAGKKKGTKKKKKKEDVSSIHPSVLSLGEQYRQHSIVGGNARCIAMMQCFKELVNDFPSDKGPRFKEDFVQRLRKPINYLTGCRKMSVSMGNGINHLKARVQALPADISNEEAKATIASEIDNYIREILMAGKVIAERCVGLVDRRKRSDHQIKDGDVVLTYGRSTAVEWVFRLAHAKAVKFEVVVVDSRPLHEGRALALALSALGIPVTCGLLNSLSSLLPRCSKVFVGASAMLTNGSLVSRSGTATVCMMAKHISVPVLCFCETYKFADKVWLGSLTNNEEAEETELLTLMNGTESPVAAHIDSDNLTIENYMYDLTPAEMLDMVVTEIGPMHPTSVPVIVRERIDKNFEYCN